MKVRHWLWGLGLLVGGLGLGFFVIKSQGATRLEAAQAELNAAYARWAELDA